MSPRVLGVIPARGGSKRVPRKNLRVLCGKPLIQYTIEAAQAAKKLTTLVVSTEDYEIGELAVALGCYVVRRPDDLAGDAVTTGAVLKHALDWMETAESKYDLIVCLHPTSPIRDPKHIDHCIALSWETRNDSVASVYKLPQKTHPNVFDGDGYAVDGSFILNASIYVVSRNWLMTMGTHVSETPVVFPMDRRHSLDIDEEIDLQIAELFLKDDQHIF